MKLKSLEIAGFRGISDLDLEFPERVNVLVGVNGAGKSAVLDCAAIMLSHLLERIRSPTGRGRAFVEHDITNGVPETSNEIKLHFQGTSVHWSVTKTRRGRRKQTLTRLVELRNSVEKYRSKIEDDELMSIPLAVYYPVNRAVLDIPLRIRTRHQFDRLAAYDEALSGKWNSFRVFFEWFREREDLENERRTDIRAFRDPQLRAVRRAVERFLPGFSGLKVRRSPLRMIICKGDQELIVNQLSDGEKCTLAMVGDLARRMAIANPRADDPLEGEAVVLIDEIDLHLHPGWQRHIAAKLQDTFRNSQFLLSTHSPQILSHLDRRCIWILERNGSNVSAKRPQDAYGQTASRILEDIMEVPARPQEVKERMTDLFLAIEQGNMTSAKHLLSSMRQTIGRDPDLVKADVLIRRKEVLGA
jgi:predicted ATP-binding protein involved in virulence